MILNIDYNKSLEAGLPFPESGFWIPDSGLQTLDSGFWFLDSARRTSDSGFPPGSQLREPPAIANSCQDRHEFVFIGQPTRPIIQIIHK